MVYDNGGQAAYDETLSRAIKYFPAIPPKLLKQKFKSWVLRK
jgi:hypothetical protein